MRLRTTSGFAATLALVSLAIMALLIWALMRLDERGSAYGSGQELVLYCAAGIQPPVQATVDRYRDEFGTRVRVHYEGSGSLLSKLEVERDHPRRSADLYLAADDSYLERGRRAGLIREVLPLAEMTLVLAVPRANPLAIKTLADLEREEVELGLANPEAAAVGKATRAALSAIGKWSTIAGRCKVFKPTVTDLTNDLKVGSLDAAILWDSVVAQYSELIAIELNELAAERRQIAIGVVAGSSRPTAALHFARYLQAPERGGQAFRDRSYAVLDGDAWADRPELVLYAGSMFHEAIEATVQQFARREGVEVRTVYNGCGVLVAQMRAGGAPDAYFSCDNRFLESVRQRFGTPTPVSENPIVMAVARDNPKRLASLHDLLQPGLRIGLAHPEKSALGHLTQRLLEQESLLDRLKQSGNWKQDAPQGDFLVNALRVGALDAALVYRSNVALARDELDTIALESEFALARQPFAVARETAYPFLAARLLQEIVSASSRQRFESLGFDWQYAAIDEEERP